jgi:hypothetical protein
MNEFSNGPTFHNDKGEKGETGKQGEKGETGKQGDKGETGKQGDSGKDGKICEMYNLDGPVRNPKIFSCEIKCSFDGRWKVPISEAKFSRITSVNGTGFGDCPIMCNVTKVDCNSIEGIATIRQAGTLFGSSTIPAPVNTSLFILITGEN